MSFRQLYLSTMLPVCDIEISLCDSFCYIFEEWVTDIPVRLGHIREVPFEPPFSGPVRPRAALCSLTGVGQFVLWKGVVGRSHIVGLWSTMWV